MPNTPITRLGNLNFITENPGTAAFRRGMQFDQQQRSGELAIEGATLTNDYNAASMPARLRNVTAGADLATTNADVASRTADNRVALTGADLRSRSAAATSAETEADVGRQTAPARVETSELGVRQLRSNTDVIEQTATDRVGLSRQNLRTATSNARNTELQSFYKAIDYAIAGNIPEAKAVAQAAGHNVPDQVWQDREFLVAMKNGAKHAETTYPSRPRDRENWMNNTYIPYVTGIRQGGGSITDPSLPHLAGRPRQPGQQPDAPPQPPEISTNANQQEPADIRTAEWLIKNGVAKSPDEAWQLVRQSRANPQTIYAQVYNNALRATFGNQAQAKKIADDFMRTQNFPVPVPGLQAPPLQPRAVQKQSMVAPAQNPPSPSIPQRPDMMTPGNGARPVQMVAPAVGAGTRERPFEASVQEHVEWFKRSAPPGAVMRINGKLYTK